MWRSLPWLVLLSLMNLATLRAQPSEMTDLTFFDGHPDLQFRLLQWETEAPDEVKAQINVLRSANQPDRHRAAKALGTMGPEAKGDIVALMDHDASIRTHAAPKVGAVS
jgi:hypothetical protein